jgi:hypothetical protein
MATNEPVATPLTSLPSIDHIPQTRDGGYDGARVREAFDAFRRHALQLQAQLRVLQAAGRSATAAEPPGHTVRMDALRAVVGAAHAATTESRGPEPEPEPAAEEEPASSVAEPAEDAS